MSALLAPVGVVLAVLTLMQPPEHTGRWRASLDLAGGELRFALDLRDTTGSLCNGRSCDPLSAVRIEGDSVVLEIADYDARIVAALHGDSLLGSYRNVGNRGPRVIPFRAARGRWTPAEALPELAGRWDATFTTDGRGSPRVLEFRAGPEGLEGTVIGNAGDYGHFWGQPLDAPAGAAQRDTAGRVALAHFDGSFVYLLTAQLDGDTLRGIFHAGLRTQTPFTAVRSTGRPHLREPDAMTRADTTAPFTFAFPDLDGAMVTSDDPRFRGKVLLVDVFGTWCPTCHDAAPALVELWNDHHDDGLEIVGLAFEVTGDTAIDFRQLRRYREKFGIEFPLLLAGVNQTELAAATLPQLEGFSAFPTTIFIGRDRRVRRIHAGFYGPATGAQHERLVAEFRAIVRQLLAEGE